MTEGRLCVKVINLERSVDRLERISAELDKANLPFDRFVATDMRSIPLQDVSAYNKDNAIKSFGRALNSGEVGVYLSHIEVLKEFLKTDSNHLLVLEDDTVVPPVKDQLVQIAQGLDERYGENWLCVNLALSMKKWRRRAFDVETSTVFHSFYFPYYSSAMLWSRTGATKFLQAGEGREINMPFDHATRIFFARNGGAFMIEPPMLLQSGSPSEIGDNLRSSTLRKRALPGAIRRLPTYLCASYQWLKVLAKRH